MKRKIYIILFVILYIIVAFSSFFHSIEFFSLSNISWMGIILAFAFEIGQAVVLFSILSDNRQRKKILPWLLMCIFTLVQIIGNVYSSYKYILLNSFEDLKFFKEPIFVWTNLPDNQTTVIVTYITSAILPICALLLTAMLTSYLGNDAEKALDQDEEQIVDEDNEEGEPNTEVEPVEEGEPVTEEDEDIIEPEAVIVEEDEPKVEETIEEPEVESHTINV